MVSKSIIRIEPLLSRGKFAEILLCIIPRCRRYVKGAMAQRCRKKIPAGRSAGRSLQMYQKLLQNRETFVAFCRYLWYYDVRNLTMLHKLFRFCSITAILFTRSLLPDGSSAERT